MAKAQLEVNQFPQLIFHWRENHRSEISGVLVFAIGVLALATWRTGDDVAWIERAVGWTAPLFAASLLIAGIVLVLRERAGYWSAESLIGAELLLFSLAASNFVYRGNPFVWGAPADGANGGVLGYMIGGLLTEFLGRGPALAAIAFAALTGVVLLIRYSPLIYGAAYGARLLPVVPVYWRWLTEDVLGIGADDEQWAGLPQTANFVPPYQDNSELESSDIASLAELFGDEPASSTGLAGTMIQPDSSQSVLAAPTGKASSKSQPKTKPSKKARTAKKKSQVARKKAPSKTTSLPPIDLLTADAGIYGGEDAQALERTIERTLEDFDVPVRVVHVESGPTVTQFGAEPLYVEKSGQRRKVRVNRIASLADDLALALAAKSVRIEAPVPGRPYVGIEVPNTDKSMVTLRGILESPAMKKKGELMMGLGRDTSGEPVVMDLTKAPHMLIAGATGSGKSVCINSILTSLLMLHGPDSLQLVLVDPKMVELPGYNGIPHLIGKVITDVEQVMGALTWLLIQMDDRYQLFREAGVRNITAYNAMARKRTRGKDAVKPLPYIVLVVDELADLMMTAAEDVERQVTRLAQMARATGIHLILATQRPSTDVVTGVIKANFPTRISFAVTSQVDSRVILDQQGAERLLGYGDMLFMRPDAAKLYRLQGCYLDDDEIDDMVTFWKENGDDSQVIVPPWNGLMDRMDDEDELLLDAIDLLREMKTCSTSMLQRKLRLGYPKAARLMGQLEDQGIVGPDQGGGQGRAVLLKDEDDEESEEFVGMF
jgi:S-DNA-T family DNA segregation ATPase FtsK/SpoIIIE